MFNRLGFSLLITVALLSGTVFGATANQSCPSVLGPYFLLASTDSSSTLINLGTQVTITDSSACVQGVRVWLTSPLTTSGSATVSVWTPNGTLLFSSSSGSQQDSSGNAWEYWSSSCIAGSAFTVSFYTTGSRLGYAAPITLPQSNSAFTVTGSVYSNSMSQFPSTPAVSSHVHMVEPLVCPTPAASCPSALNGVTSLTTDTNSASQELGTSFQVASSIPSATCMSGIRVYLGAYSGNPSAVVSLWNQAGVLQYQLSSGVQVTPGGQAYDFYTASCSSLPAASTWTVSFHTGSNSYGYAGNSGSYTPTPYFQITQSVAASSVNSFPDFASGHLHMIEPIICSSSPNQCSTNSDCLTCAKTSGCEWCLESSSCTNANSTCNSYIQNPNYCPPPPCSQYTTCSSCTSTSSSSCSWCLDSSSCVSRTAICPDRISSPSFCPSSLNLVENFNIEDFDKPPQDQ